MLAVFVYPPMTSVEPVAVSLGGTCMYIKSTYCVLPRGAEQRNLTEPEYHTKWHEYHIICPKAKPEPFEEGPPSSLPRFPPRAPHPASLAWPARHQLLGVPFTTHR